MFERFTDRARIVMALTNQEAQRLGANCLASEHMLLGLLKEGAGTGITVLKQLGLDPVKARRALEDRVRSEPQTIPLGKLPQTEGAKRVIQYAIEEARGLDHNYVGTEHLALGLVRDSGLAGQFLKESGISIDSARSALLAFFGESRSEAGGNAPADPLTKELLEIAKSLQLLSERFALETHKLIAILKQMGGR